MNTFSENKRNNYYHIDPNKYHGIIRHIMHASGEDATEVIAAIKNIRDNNINKYGATKDMVHRKLGTVPYPIYHYFEKKYPGFWNNRRNVLEFFKVFKVFATCDKI